MSFEDELTSRIKRTEEIISGYLPETEGYGAGVIEAMNYSFLAGGKRIRPILMIESHILCGGNGKLISPFMAAIEMIHTYSLVHDDLPAMDNDELRRGRPTTWKKYGDAIAVLAGDGLLNYSVETAACAFELADTPEEFELVSSALKILYHRSGIYGMIGGQCADIQAENAQTVSGELLQYIHSNKTAALIRAAMTIGAVLSGTDPDNVSALDHAAECIGLAFQIRDDLLDVTGVDDKLGKPIGSDAKNNKSTYISVHGINAAKNEVNRLSNEALDIIRGMDRRNEFLEELIEWMINRDR